MSIEFLTKSAVLTIHKNQIDTYGGQHGLRDESLLDSALAMPVATFDGEYLCQSVEEMAASYLFHLTMNHPFLDGNKRIGLACALIFLKANGRRLIGNKEDMVTFVWELAAGKMKKPDVLQFIKRIAVPI